MKKLKIIQLFTRLNLLRFLVFVFGVGLSFCSAEVFNIRDYFPNAYTFNNQSSIDSSFPLEFAVQSPIILKSFCFEGAFFNTWQYPRYLSTIVYSLDSGNTVSATSLAYMSGYVPGVSETNTNGIYCVDFPDLLLNPGDSLLWNFWGCDNGNCPTPYDLTSRGNSSASVRTFNVYGLRPVNVNNTYGKVFYNNFLINIFNHGKYAYWGPIVYYSNPSPKFKVNYGSTSYEYELNDNLFIHLKSPTIQNGNTFTYNGATGINLFYNGTSQFYNKSDLYLESMYWFNNNIFNPICL